MGEKTFQRMFLLPRVRVACLWVVSPFVPPSDLPDAKVDQSPGPKVLPFPSVNWEIKKRELHHNQHPYNQTKQRTS